MPTARRRIRLLIADDEELFREALRVLLETEPSFQVVGRASDGAEAVDLARRLNPDVLLLDVAMPRLSGLEALSAIAKESTPVRTILVTGSVPQHDMLSAMRHGARGIVLKGASPELLFESIHAVVEGQYWIGSKAVSDDAAAGREVRPAAAPPREHFKFTRRELEIIAAVVKGHSNKEIASMLDLAEITIKHHLTRIFHKVGVSSRLELALFAISKPLP